MSVLRIRVSTEALAQTERVCLLALVRLDSTVVHVQIISTIALPDSV